MILKINKYHNVYLIKQIITITKSIITKSIYLKYYYKMIMYDMKLNNQIILL